MLPPGSVNLKIVGSEKEPEFFAGSLPLFQPSARVNIPSGAWNERRVASSQLCPAPLQRPQLDLLPQKMSLPGASWVRPAVSQTRAEMPS